MLRETVATLGGDRGGGATTLPPPGAESPSALASELEGTARALHVVWIDYERVVAASRGPAGDGNLSEPSFARALLQLRAWVEGATAAVMATARAVDEGDDEDRQRHLGELLTPTLRAFVAARGPEALALGARLAPPIPQRRTSTDDELRIAFGPARTPRIGGALGDPPGRGVEAFLDGALGRERGVALRSLREGIAETASRARLAGVPDAWANRVEVAGDHLVEVGAKMTLALLDGASPRVRPHGPDVLDALGILIVAWRWLALAAAALPVAERPSEAGAVRAFARGQLAAADYWLHWELPRVGTLLATAPRGDRPWLDLPDGAFG